ncbi:SDR family oxidoreductase [Spongiibacter thalassae]|uniref:SDR family oxidoreductase n=1 Tax=Spongiibacter thalassae TaxID=2721624 RepID=UPI001B2FFFF0|nr:SDR family oxidoreductase [Spongiibacter thalassae]
MDKVLGDFSGKSVLIVGGASGMGRACGLLMNRLGAELCVLDVAEVDYPVKHYFKVDLRSQVSVDEVLAQLTERFDVVLSCAGVADGTGGIMQINFISQRYIIENLLANNKLSSQASVVLISSIAGLPWQQNLAQLKDFLGTASWQEAETWLADNAGNDNYSFSKQAANAYVASSALRLMSKGVRINSILPGPTDTPLARANADVWLGFGHGYREAAGINYLLPEQMANVMVFLASPAASGVSGVLLPVDAGHMSSAITDSYPEPAIKMMLGLE